MIQVRIAALVAALTLALVGCSDDDPGSKADPTPSTSTSTPLTPTPPTATADPVTAVEAVRNWVSERNRALTTGDTKGLRGLTSRACTSCEPYIHLIEEVYEAGGLYETKGWTVDAAKERRPLSVDAAITMHGGTRVAALGEAPSEFGEDKAILRFRVKSVDGELRVSFMGLLA